MLSIELLDKLHYYLDGAVELEDLARLDWKRQTDVVQQAFIVARLFADLGGRAVLVDGHMNNVVKAKAIASGDVKGFFNRRFHDAGLKGRRFVVYDAVSTNLMGKKGKSAQNLHFHGVFELPEAGGQTALLGKLEKVFGHAGPMNRRQFHATKMDYEKSCTHNDVSARGPLGKIFYALKHAGATYRSLNLNGGKRSRSAPANRRADNVRSSRLAHGRPSNFTKEVVFADNASKAAGKEAFNAWVVHEKKKAREASRPIAKEIRVLAAPAIIPVLASFSTDTARQEDPTVMPWE